MIVSRERERRSLLMRNMQKFRASLKDKSRVKVYVYMSQRMLSGQHRLEVLVDQIVSQVNEGKKRKKRRRSVQILRSMFNWLWVRQRQYHFQYRIRPCHEGSWRNHYHPNLDSMLSKTTVMRTDLSRKELTVSDEPVRCGVLYSPTENFDC